MRNLSRVFGMVLVLVMVLVSGSVNASTIDSTFTDVDTTMSVGDTVFVQPLTNNNGSIIGEFVCKIETNNVSTGEITLRFDINVNVSVDYLSIWDGTEYKEFVLESNSTTSDSIIFNYNETKVLNKMKLRISGKNTMFYTTLTFNSTSDWEPEDVTSVYSLNTVKTNEITLYPNPVVNTLNIGGEFEKATVFTMSGKMLVSTESSSIDMSGFEKGVYIVNVDGVSNKVIKR